MDETPIGPYALKAGEGWTYSFAELGVDFVVKVGSRGRAGGWPSSSSRRGPARSRRSTRTHRGRDLLRPRGPGGVPLRGQRFELAAGGCAFLPRGIPHGYEITGAGDARLLVLTAPAPDDGVRGWGGFVGSFEGNSEQRDAPPWDRR